jgi:1,4-dihydroxy-6-naphthoate synthase
MALKMTLGYSPCPNDTFIFYALAHGKVVAPHISFDFNVADVEELNQMALQSGPQSGPHNDLRGGLDISKISFHAFGRVRDAYRLLRCGGALGRGCGPLVVSREQIGMEDLRPGKNSDKTPRIAVPGRLTTAWLLLLLYDPGLAQSAVFMPFHKIMDAVATGKVDAGLIIHEARFTYASHGLGEVLDLGAWWERETGLPIPLGAIAAKKSLSDDVITEVEDAVKRSILYARQHGRECMPYIRSLAQELSDDVINAHIDLYVNDFTLDIGREGGRAIDTLFERAAACGVF